ncbi:MAG: hypothetical protein ACTSRP_27780 [Candidatus Helarchaeota archaeon]
MASFAEAAKQALENAIKIIILVLSFIVLAITLLGVTLCWLTLALYLMIFSLLYGFYYDWKLFEINVYDKATGIYMFGVEYNICWEYYQILDMELPGQSFVILMKNRTMFFELKVLCLIPFFHIQLPNFEELLSNTNNLRNVGTNKKQTLNTNINKEFDNPIINKKVYHSNNKNSDKNYLIKTTNDYPPIFEGIDVTPESSLIFSNEELSITWNLADDDNLNKTEDHRYRIKYDEAPFDGEFEYLEGYGSNNWSECPEWIQKESDPPRNHYESSVKIVLRNFPPNKYKFICEIAQINESGVPIDEEHYKTSNETIITIYPTIDKFLSGQLFAFISIGVQLIIWTITTRYNEKYGMIASLILPYSINVPFLYFQCLYTNNNDRIIWIASFGYQLLALGIVIFTIILNPIKVVDMGLSAVFELVYIYLENVIPNLSIYSEKPSVRIWFTLYSLIISISTFVVDNYILKIKLGSSNYISGITLGLLNICLGFIFLTNIYNLFNI